MKDLSSKRCIPCEGGVKPFTSSKIKTYLKKLSKGWDEVNGKKIEKRFKFKDFKEAMKFVNKVAVVAEKEQHHPDIEISYNKVKITLWTHSIGGLSKNDFILASKIDKLQQ